MLASIDLTQRQAARVLDQAVRTRARVTVEARCLDRAVSGSLAARENNLLCIDLHDHGHDWPLAGLVGAFCDVEIALSGCRFQFSTCIMDALDRCAPQRLLLAVPEVVQVANRRRLDRQRVDPPVEVRVSTGAAAEPFVGTLTSFGPGGAGCRLPRRPAQDLLLIDEEVRVQFELPEAGEPFDLGALVCVKTPAGDGEHLDVGLEFRLTPGDATFERLRQAMLRNLTDTAEREGES